jgi:hypothetical protein
MRITFKDGSYLEFQRSNKPGHVFVMVAVRKPDNPLELLVNSAEAELSEVIKCVQSVSGPVVLLDETYIEKGKTDDKDN